MPDATERLERALIEMAVESWRVCAAVSRMIAKLDARDANRYSNHLRYFRDRLEIILEACDLRIVSLEGHPFDPGMAAVPLNIAEFDADDALVVDRMIEPIIMGVDGLKREGTVILRRAAG